MDPDYTEGYFWQQSIRMQRMLPADSLSNELQRSYDDDIQEPRASATDIKKGIEKWEHRRRDETSPRREDGPIDSYRMHTNGWTDSAKQSILPQSAPDRI